MQLRLADHHQGYQETPRDTKGISCAALRGLLAVLLLLTLSTAAIAQTINVGSKKFTESYVLGEIAKKKLVDAGFEVDHKQGMGATAIVWEALKGGSIDAYPEYTGTISEEILKKPGLDLAAIQKELQPLGIGVTGELGFNNTYALVMKKTRAAELGIKTISDLAGHSDLKAGPTHEFLDRKDGWKPLMQTYGVKIDDVRGMEHTIGYTALNAGEIDLMDCYSTDAEIAKYDLVMLEDNKHFFPEYKAVFLYRLDMPEKAQAALKTLEGTIDEALMIKMNAKAGQTSNYAEAASIYFTQTTGKETVIERQSLTSYLGKLIGQHLVLVGISLLLAVLVGVPLGVAAARPGALGGFILGATGVIQTIPSLALLGLFVTVPFLGVRPITAILALFLYSLLPIVRNTSTGLRNIAAPLRESAEALGLDPTARLTKVYLPLAMPTILAGIKTSAVINVGTATIAALIGAGGLGEPIVSGLSLNDNSKILMGAIPAAVLAIVVQLIFDGLERAVVPRGLKVGHR